MIELTLSTGETVQLKPAPVRKFKGTRLPGSELYRAERNGYAFTFQVLHQPFFSISIRQLSFVSGVKFQVREKKKGLRLETVLTGELRVKEAGGRSYTLLPGQYMITDTPLYLCEFEAGKACSYFSAYYSPGLIESIGIQPILRLGKSIPIHNAMRDLIYEMLENPYDQHLRPFFYENSMRELLFLHQALPPFILPGEFSEAEIAAIYMADRIIAENLNSHFTIRDLAQRVGTNAFVLKKGFQAFFGVGVFGRLLQRRMDKAKQLLEKTNKPIKDVCELAGYETVAGFITAFRKRFGLTPKDWRKQKRSGL